jgi:type I restriction enzyme S subunit
MVEWKETSLENIAVINPMESLSKGVPAKKIAMEVLQPFTKKIPSYSIVKYNGGMKFRNGDTIVARITPCLENGKTAFVDILDEREIGFGSTEYIVLREKKGKSDKNYLYYFAISPEFRDVAILSMTGSSGRQRVQTDVVRNHSFSLPPLPEQKAIASVLSSLDDKIDLLHRQNKTLEAMAETIFRQWFVEDAQEDWEWVELGQFIEVMRGLSYKGAGLTEKGNGVPMHNLNSVYEGGGYKYEGIKYYSGDYKERHLVKPGDVIITNTEQGHDLLLIGYPAIVPKYFGDLGIFSQHIYRLRLKDKRITEPFLYYLLMSYDVREQIAGATNGSTVNMLSKDGIEWVKLKIPPDGKIKEFSTTVKPLLGKKESNYSQIRTLEKLRDTLLPKLMSGEVRVSV